MRTNCLNADLWFGAMVFLRADQGVQHVCKFCANAWTRARRATDRDLESSSTRRKTNAWICALLTTDHDPASVIPNKKRKSEMFVILCGPIVFFWN